MQEDEIMTISAKQAVGLFVDPSYPQWIVRDPDGNFWILPSVEYPWDQRQPYFPTAETDCLYLCRDTTKTCSTYRFDPTTGAS